MNILFSEIKKLDFEYAVDCLLECRQKSAKEFGFNYPYFTPGGTYGKQWWQIDSVLALCGYKWLDRDFAEKSLWNFIESQKDNGRICLWGADIIPKSVAGGDKLEQTEEVSSLPKIFDVTYHILKGSRNDKLKEAAYNMMNKYIEWWYSYRFDKRTGLITAVFEETFIPYLGMSGEYAPVDTNTEVYVGLHYTELLADELGKAEDAKLLEIRKSELKESINKYLWNEEKGAYYPYSIKENKTVNLLMASTFFPFRLCIASKYQQQKLMELLKNHEHFNWDTIPLTSVSKLDNAFKTTEGIYYGNASWSGNVWTLINEMVVRGLTDCGEDELASELALKTVCAFNHNCSEFINPFDGKGHGVLKYAWSASQYIELIIETIFGISYNAIESEVIISPKLTEELKNSYLSLKNLNINKNVKIDVIIDNGKVSYTISNDNIAVKII